MFSFTPIARDIVIFRIFNHHHVYTSYDIFNRHKDWLGLELHEHIINIDSSSWNESWGDEFRPFGFSNGLSGGSLPRSLGKSLVSCTTDGCYVIPSALRLFFIITLYSFYKTIKVSAPRLHGDFVLILTPIEYKSLLMKNLSSFYLSMT